MFKKFLGYTLILFSIFILILIGITIYERDASIFKFIGQLLLAAIMFFQGRSYCKENSIHSGINEHLIKQESSVDIAFDQAKRELLVAKLKSMEIPVIQIKEFFDGNFADYGSIGCNIYPAHPGIQVFKNVFDLLLSRNDVAEIYAHISEIDPGDDCWPYTDRIYVFGTISQDELMTITKPIEPTEIGDAKGMLSSIPKSIHVLNENPLTVLWWD